MPQLYAFAILIEVGCDLHERRPSFCLIAYSKLSFSKICDVFGDRDTFVFCVSLSLMFLVLFGNDFSLMIRF